MSNVKQSLRKWEAFTANIRRLKVIDHETEDQKAKRIERLKKDFVAFSKYYFPEYCSAEFAPFHIKVVNKLINNNEIYLVAALAREHGKSVLLGTLIPAFLMFTGKLYNMLLVSYSYDNAVELLMPLILNLEENQRIINDFGQQKGFNRWESGNWHTISGCSFRAIGAGQSPRGTRNEEKRPDFILIDDIDTDEESRNQSRIDNKWNWIEQALFPCMSISGTKRFVFAGNIISKESTIVKASRVADFFIKVNILDAHGKPSWSRYTIEQVNYMLSKISYASGQKEYFNNPISEGTVFKDITWGKCPPLSKFRYLIGYCDPSYKASRKNDFKAIPLVGEYDGSFYVVKAYCQQTTVGKMIQWYYDLDEYIGQATTPYFYIEAGSLQETFYEEIFLPQLVSIGKAKGKHLSISPDHRKKTDKFTRIEATLEPINRQGRLIFNEREQKDPHMLRLIDQLKAIEPSLPAHDDGPDALEGAVWIINNKLSVFRATGKSTRRKSKKY